MTTVAHTLRRLLTRTGRPTASATARPGPRSCSGMRTGGATDTTDAYLDDLPNQRWKVQLLGGHVAR